jgi:hypothetical protein
MENDSMGDGIRMAVKFPLKGDRFLPSVTVTSARKHSCRPLLTLIQWPAGVKSLSSASSKTAMPSESPIGMAGCASSRTHVNLHTPRAVGDFRYSLCWGSRRWLGACRHYGNAANAAGYTLNCLNPSTLCMRYDHAFIPPCSICSGEWEAIFAAYHPADA